MGYHTMYYVYGQYKSVYGLNLWRCCVRMQFELKIKSSVTFNFNYAVQIGVGLRNRSFDRIWTSKAPRSLHLASPQRDWRTSYTHTTLLSSSVTILFNALWLSQESAIRIRSTLKIVLQSQIDDRTLHQDYITRVKIKLLSGREEG